MKRLLLFFAFAAALSAQTVTINLSIPTTPDKAQDILTHWTDAVGGPVCTPSLDSTAQSTQITCDQLYVAANNFGVGAMLAWGSEPVKVTAVAPAGTDAGGNPTFPVLTVTRAAQSLTTATTHKGGTPLYALIYPDPYTQVMREVLLPWMNGIIDSLAKQGRSATMPIVAPTGSVSVTP